MSIPKSAQPAKLIVGALVNDLCLFDPVLAELISLFGPVERLSPWYEFEFTNYYKKEMGAPLHRRVAVFEKLMDQATLAAVKLRTNAVEARFAEKDKRCVNLDPGYLMLERFVLATGKNFTHRIYIGLGIYADLTLIFQNDAFQPLPWTYPDYQDHRLRAFLLKVRQHYKRENDQQCLKV